MQTWEYSPVYALRSYAYLLLHTWPAALIFNKVWGQCHFGGIC